MIGPTGPTGPTGPSVSPTGPEGSTGPTGPTGSENIVYGRNIGVLAGAQVFTANINNNSVYASPFGAGNFRTGGTPDAPIGTVYTSVNYLNDTSTLTAVKIPISSGGGFFRYSVHLEAGGFPTTAGRVEMRLFSNADVNSNPTFPGVVWNRIILEEPAYNFSGGLAPAFGFQTFNSFGTVYIPATITESVSDSDRTIGVAVISPDNWSGTLIVEERSTFSLQKV